MTTSDTADHAYKSDASRAQVAAVSVRVAPTLAVAAAVWGLAWLELGSIAARDWLLYAVLTVLLVGTVLASGLAHRPTRAASVTVAALLGLAGWTAISLAWSPAPTLARDEALLVVFYAAAFAVPSLTLRSGRDRMAALTGVVLVLGALAVAVALELRFGGTEELQTRFLRQGRLYWPVSYAGGQAALFLVGFWPAVMLAARRGANLAIRAAALGCGTAFLAGWLLTQSRAALAALTVSAVVVLALVPARLRLVVPAALAGGLAAAGFPRLTAAYGLRGDDLVDPVREAAGTMLVVAAAGALLGLLYALVDRRVTVPARAARVAGIGLVAAAAASLAVVVPGIDFGERWEEFKREPAGIEGDTHFANPGSNRYDFWLVATRELAEHPVAGIGARGFFSAYLREGNTVETPARAHSLPLDVLAEEGVIGFAALVVALGAALAAPVRRRARVPPAAALGAGAYWLSHALVDWTWTLPAAGLPFFLLLGIAASGDRPGRLRGRVRWPAMAGATVLALLALAPPWLSLRLADDALVDGDRRDLRWARRLDPLSTTPYLAEALLAPSPQQAIAPLLRAAEKEPRSVAVHIRLFHAYREAARPREARKHLLTAIELAPREKDIRRLLRPSE
jgi:hypothetical protein